jgi:hypothetical protein
VKRESHEQPLPLAKVRAAMAEFLELCNYGRCHEGIGNVTPADVYFGRREAILRPRGEQKQAPLYDKFRYNLGRSSDQPRGEQGSEL